MYQETRIGIDMYIYYIHKKFIYNDMIFTMQMVVEVCLLRWVNSLAKILAVVTFERHLTYLRKMTLA